MAKHKIILFIFFVFVTNSNCSDTHFVCGASKSISKCFCGQETDKFQNIPLFSIDCSRLDFRENPTQDVLPLLMGHLDLSHNKISVLNDSVKLSSSTLYYLDYSYNKIKHISPKFFANLTELINLNLGHNKLEKLNSFDGLINLKVLNLERNKLKTLPDNAFLSLNSLKDLTLSYNNIGNFIEKNGLGDYVPSSINSLFLERVNLTKLEIYTFAQHKHLKKISIAFNPITNLTYLPLSYLEYLDISGTNISNLTAGDLMFHDLKILRMNRLLQLRQINDYTFYNLQNLKELYIEHCVNLKEISPLVFGYINENNSKRNFTIEKFTVAYSGLITLPQNFQILFENIPEIHLKGNFWHCDCNLSWFKHLKKNVKDVNQVRCSSPESEANKTVHNITEKLTCVEVKKLKNPSPYRPTQSFLFPVVGVLSIIVIILVSILIYMGPTNSNRKKIRHIGPDSPYNPITIQPNEAEYYFNNNNVSTVS